MIVRVVDRNASTGNQRVTHYVTYDTLLRVTHGVTLGSSPKWTRRATHDHQFSTQGTAYFS
ncbi:protein of unknown function [Pseudomonas sp. JV551A1]|uniref:Uncharacterized protein n=1 Tax=Pseudomonas inefficax TaxID=2078786 RepID=A0AAQ1P9N3_9PSED|nr:protein of unknown function [Pseudomonas sp. JV551A1]SPO62424.1 protein of unknown function [Pseudomonas inefficax]